MKFFLHAFSELVRGGALTLAFGCAALALLGQGGRFSDWLDVINHGMPILLAGAVLALLIWLLTGRHGVWTPALAALAIGSALIIMGPELIAAARQKPDATAAPTLKVLQFNLWYKTRDPESTTRWILEQDADIVVFEESYKRSGGIVRALADRYPYVATCADPYPCSTVVLSKRRPSATGGLAKWGPGWLSGAWATFPSEAGPFTIVGVHYTWPVPAGPQQQQTLRMAKAIEQFPKESLIVSGDFNATPWSYSLRRQDRLFGLERRTRALASFPAGDFLQKGVSMPFPILPIDHIYAGKDWRTVSVKRGPRLGSDHYPVVIELARR